MRAAFYNLAKFSQAIADFEVPFRSLRILPTSSYIGPMFMNKS